MQSKRRVGQAAQQVIDATRCAGAVDRAGQLRMLSQRIAEAAILSALSGAPPGGDAEMRRAEADFEQGLASPAAKPLSTDEIQALMA